MTSVSHTSEMPVVAKKDYRAALLAGALLCVISYFIFLPIVRFVAKEEVDYLFHQEFILDALNGMPIINFLAIVPHFLFHLLVYIAFRVLPGGNLMESTVFVTVGLYIGTAAAVYWLLCRFWGAPKTYWIGMVYAGITLALMLLMPITIFTPENLFVGWIGVNAYHNPTIVVLKPLAVVMFWCAYQSFAVPPPTDGMVRRRSVPVWLCALATVLCILAKPSYMIALLPALVIFAAYWIIRRKGADWTLLFFGILFPAGVVMVLQFALFQNSTGFIFAPLAVIYSWTRINPDAPVGWELKFVLSILFPLLVYLLNFRTAVKSLYLNLAWLVFAFGAAYMYLLAEGGDRLAHANFTWSTISALFILFIVSVIFLVQQVRDRGSEWSAASRLAAAICGIVFGLHLVSGLYWYHIHITANWMGDIIANKW